MSSSAQQSPAENVSRPSESVSDSLSVIVAARNEAPRLERTINDVIAAAEHCFQEWELIIVNDGSNDGTAEIADRIAGERKGIRVLHLDRGHGLGGAFKQGLALASKDYVTVAHGDGGTPSSELIKIWQQRTHAEIVVPFISNENQRPRWRLNVSKLFRTLVNALFAIQLRYHLHYILYPREPLQRIRIRCDGHPFQAEAAIKLLRRGHSFVEVGVNDAFEEQGPSQAFGGSQLWSVTKFFLWTLYDVYLSGDYRRPHSITSRTGRGE